MPAIVVFTGVILYPFGNSMGLSLFRVTLMTVEPMFDGFANFRRLVEEPALLVTWCTRWCSSSRRPPLTFALGLAWALIVQPVVPRPGAAARGVAAALGAAEHR